MLILIIVIWIKVFGNIKIYVHLIVLFIVSNLNFSTLLGCYDRIVSCYIVTPWPCPCSLVWH